MPSGRRTTRDASLLQLDFNRHDQSGAKDFFHFADFPLHFARDFVGRAEILQIRFKQRTAGDFF
jgi:hypothetical protein